MDWETCGGGRGGALWLCGPRVAWGMGGGGGYLLGDGGAGRRARGRCWWAGGCRFAGTGWRSGDVAGGGCGQCVPAVPHGRGPAGPPSRWAPRLGWLWSAGGTFLTVWFVFPLLNHRVWYLDVLPL